MPENKCALFFQECDLIWTQTFLSSKTFTFSSQIHMPTGYQLLFSQIILIVVDGNTTTPVLYTVPAGCVWKIESAGVAGSNGTIYLMQDYGTSPPAPAPDKIAILATSIGEDDYASQLPYWLPTGFTARFRNESGFKGSVSITEYVIG